jgi:DNA polymerase elongation subunit (family B)
MAYEEVLYPVFFFAKKYYAGMIHTTHFEENPKILMKGIALVKKDISKVCEIIGTDFLKTLFNLNIDISSE